MKINSIVPMHADVIINATITLVTYCYTNVTIIGSMRHTFLIFLWKRIFDKISLQSIKIEPSLTKLNQVNQ